MSEIIDLFIEYIEDFRSGALRTVYEVLDQFDKTDMEHRKNKLENDLVAQFYTGLLYEFEASLLVSADKEAYSDFIKGVPILLEELHRLELYVKTLNIQGIKIDKTIKKLLDLWFQIL